MADAGIFTKERKDADGLLQPVTIPESVTILGRYADGCRLGGHFSGVETSSPRAEIRLNGSRGGLRLDLVKSELWLAKRGEADWLVEILPSKRGGWRVEQDFVDSIREKRPVHLTDFRTGVRYMHFTEAVWESWNNNGARVTL
jgi:predicted dehydrogenase